LWGPGRERPSTEIISSYKTGSGKGFGIKKIRKKGVWPKQGNKKEGRPTKFQSFISRNYPPRQENEEEICALLKHDESMILPPLELNQQDSVHSRHLLQTSGGINREKIRTPILGLRGLQQQLPLLGGVGWLIHFYALATNV
jgi:hypothetical protein